ncbi:MAG: helix-turn-helix transcriptional regulator [Oscillospiraceae bacterium]|nr:helix-turn-helix transcriptional regulator [Oscillospiraceae bacterium]
MKLNLGNQIRLNRRRMNLTQEQLAEKFGTSPQAISRWEIGATYPDIEMLPMIASFFEMSVDALLGVTEEEKEKFCAELQKSFEIAVRAKEIQRTIEIMREIRCNLREYQNYWFFGLYHEIWNARLFRDEKVLEEMRLLTEEIFSVCPKDNHYAVIGCMANMEDDEHIDAFLDAYASREDMARSTLLFNRYKMREEIDKIEPVRQYILWMELSHIISAANDWQKYLCKDPKHFIWFCETQLNYLNAVNNLSPDKKHMLSGGDALDLWCEERIQLGIRYTAAFAKLGKMDEAYDAFEDTIRVIEQIMAITDEEFKMDCSSPAFEGFSLDSEIHWMEKSGKEYKEISLRHNDWWNWIIPLDYQKAFKHAWFDTMRADERFDALFERLDKCVVCRELSNN